MREIRILTDRVANQIAAGEVVERPAAVVKELSENSIDAGSSKIEIEFRNGGKSYLRVEDNGLGMNPDQALMSLERHATSKIRKASDLNEVKTFGFRGEALPSISSVCRFVMRTRSKSMTEGSEIFLNGGKMIHVKDCGMPVGTRIEVSHLFNSVPGRRKFLKTEVTESAHIIHISKLYALAHSKIEFSLLENGRTLFRSPACDDFLDRVREIFGKGLADSLAMISVSKDGFQLEGFVGKPGNSRSTRKEMIFFVNQRPVDSKTLSYSVLEAYHSYAPKGRFPPAILFLSLDASLVDINVHPAKREIRFREESKVRSFLIESLLAKNKELSGMLELTPEKIDLAKDEYSGRLVPKIDPGAFELYKKNSPSPGTADSSLDLIDSKTELSASTDHGQNLEGDNNSSKIFIDKLVGERKDPHAVWRFLTRCHGELALFSTPDGITALHTRAAYERIQFEELENTLSEKENSESQVLLFPESFELDGVDSKNLKQGLKSLKGIGFLVEEFGRNFYRLESCPKWLEPEQASKFIKDFIDIAREEGGPIKTESFAKEALVRQSTQNSGIQDHYSDQEIIELVEKLLKCRNPYVCPKGKPTHFEIPKREFENRLKRKL